MLPKHVYAGSDPRNNPANSAPVGTGPFRFVKWEKGQFIQAERNDKYWDAGKPYLDKLIFRIVPDASARAVGLESGDLDLGGPGVLAELKAKGVKMAFEMRDNPGTAFAFISDNAGNAIELIEHKTPQ